MPNRVKTDGAYPHFDVDAIWQWIVEGLTAAAKTGPITHICVATHGSAAALVTPDPKVTGNGLSLPIMDYEWDGIETSNAAYEAIRPPFEETYSPRLPGGLNLGQQLFWQQENHPDAFAAARHILPYAQYWSWRLCGVMATDVCALGAHSDLWAAQKGTWSTLAKTKGWDKKFAPIRPAWLELGALESKICAQTGLAPTCRVLTGVHDSNASYARFLPLPVEQRPTVISTGTWAVCMHPNGDADRLRPARDMLMNIDINGAPVACARYMGGREFEEICRLCDTDGHTGCTVADIQAIIDANVMALPDFSGGSGPFGGRAAALIGKTANGYALATLYAALMLDVELALLDARGAVVVEGSFAENGMLCALLASLRPDQEISRLECTSGIAQGCLGLTNWRTKEHRAPPLIRSVGVSLNHLARYRRAWLRQCGKG